MKDAYMELKLDDQKEITGYEVLNVKTMKHVDDAWLVDSKCLRKKLKLLILDLLNVKLSLQQITAVYNNTLLILIIK